MGVSFASRLGTVLDSAGGILESGIDRYIDRELQQDQVVVVNDPVQVKAVESTGSPGVPDTYAAGTVSVSDSQVFGVPWQQALLWGSAALLAVGLTLKMIVR